MLCTGCMLVSIVNLHSELCHLEVHIPRLLNVLNGCLKQQTSPNLKYTIVFFFSTHMYLQHLIYKLGK